MNKGRRAELDKAIELLTTAGEIIVRCAEEEREYYDNMAENLQGSERGQKADEAAGALEGVDIDSIIGEIEEAKGE